MPVFKVLAHWDQGAGVWWAESEDVRGLVAEAATLEELIADLRSVVPELLTMNHPESHFERAEIAVLADRVESISVAA